MAARRGCARPGRAARRRARRRPVPSRARCRRPRSRRPASSAGEVAPGRRGDRGPGRPGRPPADPDHHLGRRPGCAAARSRPGSWRPGAAGPRRRSRSPARTCPSRRPARPAARTCVGTRMCASRTVSAATASRSTGRRCQRPLLVQPGQQQQVVDEQPHPADLALDARPSPRPAPARAGRRRAGTARRSPGSRSAACAARATASARNCRSRCSDAVRSAIAASIRTSIVLSAMPSRPDSVCGSASSTRRDRSPPAISAAVVSIRVSGRSPSRTTRAAATPIPASAPGVDRGAVDREQLGLRSPRPRAATRRPPR